MRQLDIAVGVLEHEASRALKHSRTAAGEAGGMLARRDAAAPGLDADETHIPVAHERVEDPHGVTAAADARDDGVRQPAAAVEDLRACLFADHRLELTHHQ